MSATPRTILLICRAAPCDGTRARDTLDAAMACGIFDLPVTLLFSGDGVYATLAGQDPAAGSARNVGKMLGALPDHGVTAVHACAAALHERGLATADLVAGVSAADARAIATLVAGHDIVLTI